MPETKPYQRGLTKLWKPRPNRAESGTLVERILATRGVSDPGEIRAFLNPSLNQLHDPSLMPDLDIAAERILNAARSREAIVIYGDYDVDGVTATAILFHTLKAISPECDVRTYVPHRLDEGYGINAAAIEQLASEGAKVVVSVDCGITAIEPALVAKRAGVDLIITDHHNLPANESEMPDAFGVVHPRRPGSAYPFGDLSGAGVAYKLAWRLATVHCGASRVSPALREVLLQMLAFAALGAIADVVPLKGENRVLASFGLGRIKHSSVPGLRALVEASGLAGEHIDAEHAGFSLGPRLNACGRMGHAKEAVELFTTATGERAMEIAEKLTKLNNERRATEKKIADHACAMAEESGMTSGGQRAIVLSHPDWHPGVIGIVCSRLVDRFCRPTILMQNKDGVCKGSGRSIDGFSLHRALTRCASLLTSYGGHDMAAGLKLDESRLQEFTRSFLDAANGEITDDQLTPSLHVDCDATLDEMTAETVGEIEKLAPFGMGNPRPRVRLLGTTLAFRPDVFGSSAKHLSLKVKAKSTPRIVRIVGWNWADRRDQLAAGMEVEVVVSPRLSSWNGVTSVEPELADVRIATSFVG